MCDEFYSSAHSKFERSSKLGWARRLNEGREPDKFVASAPWRKSGDHLQILEKGE